MNTLPIVGLTVADVVPGYSLQIHLSADSIIQLEQPFAYTTNSGETTVDPSQGDPDTSVIKIEGTEISTARYSESNVLTLIFSNGDSIFLTPDDTGYEAWHVTTPDEVIIGRSLGRKRGG